MSDDREHLESHAIDRLVADHLERLSRRVDATALIDRVSRQLPDDSSRRFSRKSPVWTRPLLATVATALVVAVAFLGGRSFAPAQAQAAVVLRDVRQAHFQPVDRCYHVHFAPDPDYRQEHNPLTGPSDTVLWTRGDRFWADATLGTIKLVYGRDEQGKIWVSPGRSTGIRLFDGDDKLPEEIVMYCAINSMTVPALVENVLADFDLRVDEPPHVDGASQPDVVRSGAGNPVIWATLKPAHTHSLISSALLEVDDSDTLVRVVLWTVDEGRPRGTVTFTLVDTAQIGDDQYQLTSHLDPGAEIKDHPNESTSDPSENE